MSQTVTFINLSNGVEAIDIYGLSLSGCRFLRLQSTACEQKLWEDILLDLSPDFLLLASLGCDIAVYDFGARKPIPRAIWQGLEWVKYALMMRWLGVEYTPVGRAASSGSYFAEQYGSLSRKTKKHLDYYKKFCIGEVHIRAITSATAHDGDLGYFLAVLRRALDNHVS